MYIALKEKVKGRKEEKFENDVERIVKQFISDENKKKKKNVI